MVKNVMVYLKLDTQYGIRNHKEKGEGKTDGLFGYPIVNGNHLLPQKGVSIIRVCKVFPTKTLANTRNRSPFIIAT